MNIYKLNQHFISKSKTLYSPGVYLESELPKSIFEDDSIVLELLNDEESLTSPDNRIVQDETVASSVELKRLYTKAVYKQDKTVIDPMESGEVPIEIKKEPIEFELSTRRLRGNEIELEEDVYIIPNDQLQINDSVETDTVKTVKSTTKPAPRKGRRSTKTTN